MIANPGCYPTAIQLALIPLLKKKLINPTSIIADAKSGISGAGKNPELKLLMSEAEEDFRAYGIGGQRHLPEIEENLANICGDDIKLTFIPHLVPMIRGIHATLYVDCIEDFNAEEIFESFYKDEPFVDIMPVDSCQPIIIFIFCTACPAAPFIRLSITEKIISLLLAFSL